MELYNVDKANGHGSPANVNLKPDPENADISQDCLMGTLATVNLKPDQENVEIAQAWMIGSSVTVDLKPDPENVDTWQGCLMGSLATVSPKPDLEKVDISQAWVIGLPATVDLKLAPENVVKPGTQETEVQVKLEQEYAQVYTAPFRCDNKRFTELLVKSEGQFNPTQEEYTLLGEQFKKSKEDVKTKKCLMIENETNQWFSPVKNNSSYFGCLSCFIKNENHDKAQSFPPSFEISSGGCQPLDTYVVKVELKEDFAAPEEAYGMETTRKSQPDIHTHDITHAAGHAKRKVNQSSKVPLSPKGKKRRHKSSQSVETSLSRMQNHIEMNRQTPGQTTGHLKNPGEITNHKRSAGQNVFEVLSSQRQTSSRSQRFCSSDSSSHTKVNKITSGDHKEQNSAPKNVSCTSSSPVKSEQNDEESSDLTPLLPKRFQCEQCHSSFRQKGHLNGHVKRVHVEKNFECSQCHTRFKTKYQLTLHMKDHVSGITRSRNYKCDECSKDFFTIYHLKEHKKRAHSQSQQRRDFLCHVCAQQFNRQSHLKAHMYTHTGERPYVCSICKATFKKSSRLANHRRRSHNDSVWECEICRLQFSSMLEHRQHMTTHNGGGFVCDICDSWFEQKGNLKVHLRTHTGERPFVCSVCGYATAQQSNLKSHMRRHTGERPYACNVCDFAASTFFELKKHLKTHPQFDWRRPWACSTCPATFWYKKELKSHQYRDHTSGQESSVPSVAAGLEDSGDSGLVIKQEGED